MRILVVADYFLPGCRAGGPIRSLKNFVQEFGRENEIYVVTRDRDFGDSAPYEIACADQWVDLAGSKVCYLDPSRQSGQTLRTIINDLKPDLVYLNSLFSPFSRRILMGARAGQLHRCKLLMAVRGELNPGAMAIKPIRKRVFLMISGWLGWFRNVEFQASSEIEEQFIRQTFPTHSIHVAMDIPDAVLHQPRSTCPRPVRFVFNSRVSPIKNIEVVLRAFESLIRCGDGFDATLAVHGDTSDKAYEEVVQSLARMCGDRIEFHGGYDHTEIWGILKHASFTVLPSRGENFAHSIYESAAAGVPLLISDRTPWTSIAQQGAGWVIDPDDTEGWTRRIGECLTISDEEYQKRSQSCIDSAKAVRKLAMAQHQKLLAHLGE